MTHIFDSNIETITDDKGQPYPDCLIIDRPDLKSMPLVLGEGLLTVLFWGFWFYLWLPLVSLLAWGFGVQIFYKQMVALGGLSGFIHHLNVFLSGIALVSGAIAFWSLYNLKRYGLFNRRTSWLETDMDQLADSINMPGQKLTEIQQGKHIIFSFGEDDSIKGVDISPVRKPQKPTGPDND